jgi:hypothetical protein
MFSDIREFQQLANSPSGGYYLYSKSASNSSSAFLCVCPG